jgi:hypothetical protein
MLSIKFQFIPESGFREDFLEINQKQEWLVAAMFNMDSHLLDYF